MKKLLVLTLLMVGFYGCTSNDDNNSSGGNSETVTVQSLQNILNGEDWHIVAYSEDGVDLLPTYNAWELDFYSITSVRANFMTESREGHWNVYAAQSNNPNAPAVLVLNFDDELLGRLNQDWLALSRNANRVSFQKMSGDLQPLNGYLTLERH